MPSNNQITGNQNWRQEIREVIRTGNSQKLFCRKQFINSGTIYTYSLVVSEIALIQTKTGTISRGLDRGE